MSGVFGKDPEMKIGASVPWDGVGGAGAPAAPQAAVAAPAPDALSVAESKATKLVDAEQARTERQRVETIQRQLSFETLSRSRGYGIRSLIGVLGGRGGYLGSG